MINKLCECLPTQGKIKHHHVFPIPCGKEGKLRTGLKKQFQWMGDDSKYLCDECYKYLDWKNQ